MSICQRGDGRSLRLLRQGLADHGEILAGCRYDFAMRIRNKIELTLFQEQKELIAGREYIPWKSRGPTAPRSVGVGNFQGKSRKGLSVCPFNTSISRNSTSCELSPTFLTGKTLST